MTHPARRTFLKTYTVEIYAPAYDGRALGARPSRRMRVHCGTFEQNRDSLSPSMIETNEVQAFTIDGARETGKILLRRYLNGTLNKEG